MHVTRRLAMQQEANLGTSIKNGQKAPYLTFTYQLALNEARQWKIASLCLLLLSLALVIAIATIMPLKEIQVRYVEFLSGKDIYFNMHPANISIEQKQELIKQALRNYVAYANISDRISARPRFAEVKAMSNAAVYAQMQAWYKNLHEALGQDGTRDVNITYAQPVTNSIFEVEFETVDTIHNIESRRTWVAKLEYEVNDKHTINTSEATYNPLGIKIKQYHISERVK